MTRQVQQAEPAKRTRWHAAGVADLADRFGTPIETGLDDAAARAALDEHGPNELPEPRRRGLGRMLVDQLADFMIIVLIAAAVVSGLVGEPVDTIAIVVIVLLNAVLGVVQEYRADQAMSALRTMAAPQATVRRDGRPVQVPAREVVPGDVVLLEAGNVVPADVRLVEAARLAAQEAAMTGESLPVEKDCDVIESGADGEVDHVPLADQTNMAFKGTTISAGRGVGLAVATGQDTELGAIARMLGSTATVKTPLQRRLARFGTVLALAVLVICLVVFLAGLARGEDPALVFLTAVSLAVAAIPEALPAVVAISLALGAYRMVGQHALIRRLPAVETLGSITTICSDKTGTLTENRMRVESVVADGEDAVRRLWECAVLCNDAQPGTAAGGGGGEVVGEPTEVALVEGALAAGVDVVGLRRGSPRVGELPFDSDRKRMSTLHPLDGDRVRVCVKGAPEVVLERTTHWLTATGVQVLPAAVRHDLEERIRALAADGMRVLAVAEARRRIAPVDDVDDHVETDLTLLGLVALMDPPRAEAFDAVQGCRQAGITPVMITGDHPATARAIAARLGICETGPDDDALVLTGSELAGLDDAALAERVRDVRVYARVDPAQKIRIVAALQEDGELVAMTGDGVNDAPALKRADIGIAMGRGGTDVAREAAAMVLLDDNFATIVHAVGEGRRIYDNIRKFVKYTMTSNSGEIWLIFTAPFIGLPLPLLPIHILWVNLVTDGLPGIMLARESAEPDVMRRRPRPPSESVFAHGLWQHVIWVGLLMGGVCLAVQALARQAGAPWQTMVFTVLTLSQLGHVLAIRSERDPLWRLGVRSNPWLMFTVVGTVVLQLATIYVPALNGIFATEPLSIGELAVCLAVSGVVYVAVEVEKAVRRARHPGPRSPATR